MDADEFQLQSFKEADIEMGDTAFGGSVDRKKREESAVYGRMSVEERESLKLAQREIDEQEKMQDQFARWGWRVHVNNSIVNNNTHIFTVSSLHQQKLSPIASTPLSLRKSP